jgi:hypothetical protein
MQGGICEDCLKCPTNWAAPCGRVLKLIGKVTFRGEGKSFTLPTLREIRLQAEIIRFPVTPRGGASPFEWATSSGIS